MIEITVNQSDIARFNRLAAAFPKESYKGLGRAASVFRARMRKIMKSGGGLHGVEKFPAHAPETMALNAFEGKDNVLGGKLAKSSSIQMYRKNKGEFTIGFISALQGYASAFQDPENRAMDKNEKLRFWRAGVRRSMYSRTSRPLLEPFSADVRTSLIDLAIKNTEKILSGARK